MIERKHNRYGPIDLRCDGCADGVLETGERDFAEAMVVVKEQGWRAMHLGAGHGWCHFCPDCVADRAWEAVTS